jgi:hypothetical protein
MIIIKAGWLRRSWALRALGVTHKRIQQMDSLFYSCTFPHNMFLIDILYKYFTCRLCTLCTLEALWAHCVPWMLNVTAEEHTSCVSEFPSPSLLWIVLKKNNISEEVLLCLGQSVQVHICAQAPSDSMLSVHCVHQPCLQMNRVSECAGLGSTGTAQSCYLTVNDVRGHCWPVCWVSLGTNPGPASSWAVAGRQRSCCCNKTARIQPESAQKDQ